MTNRLSRSAGASSIQPLDPTSASAPRSALSVGSRRRWSRLLIGAGLATVAAITLSACQPPKVGAVATVVGQRIDTDQVNALTGSPTATPAASASGSSFTYAQRRLLVVNVLVTNLYYDQVLKQAGGPGTDAENTAAKAQVLSSGTDDDLTTKIEAAGFPGSFEKLYVQAFTKQLVFATRKNITTQTALDAALNGFPVAVSVSPRYGTWSTTQHQVVDAVAPAYLLPSPSPTPAAQASS